MISKFAIMIDNGFIRWGLVLIGSFLSIWLLVCWSSKGYSDDSPLKFIPGDSISTRFRVPTGFERVQCQEQEFGYYLQSLPLKEKGTLVSYYNGSQKDSNNVYEAVVDLPIGNKDLHQCADAVMRLRAEYLWKQKRYNEIHFHFTNGFDVPYENWMNGYRIVIHCNKTNWTTTAQAPSNTRADFWSYMETIFMYAGTLSLSRELNAVNENALQIGDVFIQGGSPGHAVIVVDMAQNKQTGEKKFILAQSYMPAQEIQILKNPKGEGVWFSDRELDPLETPEWTFSIGSLKRF
jgi:hypothetical protein